MIKLLKVSTKVFCLTVCFFILGGCSAFSVGEDPSCPGLPKGVTCKSAKDVYQMTNYRKNLENMSQEEADELEAIALGKKSTLYKSGFKRHKRTQHTTHGTIRKINKENLIKPVNAGLTGNSFEQLEQLRLQEMLRDEQSIMRTKAKILRMKFAKWEDDDGRLHDPGKIYVEIEGRKWVLGTKKMATPAVITPLQIRELTLEEIRSKEEREGK